MKMPTPPSRELLPKEQLLTHIQGMQLKHVVKESHASPVQDLVVNMVDADNGNLFATVGKDQASVYDGAHFGDHIGVVVNFVNEKTEYADGGELTKCVWLPSDGVSPHPQGDARIAVAGKDNCVSIISVVETRVTELLRGHEREIIDLAVCPSQPGLLLSLSLDGTVRLWDVVAETCVQVYEAQGSTAVAFAPDGGAFFTANKKQDILKWQVPDSAVKDAQPASKRKRFEGPATVMSEVEGAEVVASGAGTAPDCLRFMEGGNFLSRAADGTHHVWDPVSWDKLRTWRVPNCKPKPGAAVRLASNPSPCGSFVACGNNDGEVFVYDAFTAKKVKSFKPERVSGEVKAAALTRDCRHLLAVYGNGFIFRYEFKAAPASGDASEGGGGEEMGGEDAVEDIDGGAGGGAGEEGAEGEGGTGGDGGED